MLTSGQRMQGQPTVQIFTHNYKTPPLLQLCALAHPIPTSPEPLLPPKFIAFNYNKYHRAWGRAEGQEGC